MANDIANVEIAVEERSVKRVRPGRKIPVVELFGPVIQGEGVMIGRPTTFVRFGYCDYKCVWCDSMYAVNPDEVKEYSEFLTQEEIAERLIERTPPASWITFSGGNPCMHDLTKLVTLLKAAGRSIQVETQGTIFREWLNMCDQVTVSPKPPSSMMETNHEQLMHFLMRCTAPKILKVVVFDDSDFRYARMIHKRYPVFAFYLSVGNNVGVNSSEDLLMKLEWLWNKVLPCADLVDVSVLPQLHVLIYGNKKGV